MLLHIGTEFKLSFYLYRESDMEPFPPRNSIECTVVSSPELDMIVGELDKKPQSEGTLNDGGGRGERLQLGDPFDDSVGETQLEGPLKVLQEPLENSVGGETELEGPLNELQEPFEDSVGETELEGPLNELQEPFEDSVGEETQLEGPLNELQEPFEDSVGETELEGPLNELPEPFEDWVGGETELEGPLNELQEPFEDRVGGETQLEGPLNELLERVGGEGGVIPSEEVIRQGPLVERESVRVDGSEAAGGGTILSCELSSKSVNLLVTIFIFLVVYMYIGIQV